MPVANKLNTVKKCLNEVLKYGGPFSPRDLYPVSARRTLQGPHLRALQYQLALFQIDSMRKDGKFVGEEGNIPEGQGIVMAHLNECHELIEMVRIPPLLAFVPPLPFRLPRTNTSLVAKGSHGRRRL